MRFSSIFALFLVFTSMLAAQEPMAWQQRTDVGSPGLYEGAAMAFDEQQGVMLHFGGSAAWTVIGALAYSTNNGTNWTCLDTPFIRFLFGVPALSKPAMRHEIFL